MYTVAKNAEHNQRLIMDFLKMAYPSKDPSIKELINDNIINGARIVELAVSRVAGLEFSPTGYNQDFIDMSDVKTATLQKHDRVRTQVLASGTKKRYKSTSYTVSIGDVNKKYGVLRIIAWNKFLNKYHFFRIPPSAVFNRSILKITFDGETISPTGKYAQYEVSSFEEVSAPLNPRELVSTITSNISEQTIELQIDKIMSLIKNNSSK
jgi:hypothetical protein